MPHFQRSMIENSSQRRRSLVPTNGNDDGGHFDVRSHIPDVDAPVPRHPESNAPGSVDDDKHESFILRVAPYDMTSWGTLVTDEKGGLPWSVRMKDRDGPTARNDCYEVFMRAPCGGRVAEAGGASV